jgi:hypothetical protein
MEYGLLLKILIFLLLKYYLLLLLFLKIELYLFHQKHNLFHQSQDFKYSQLFHILHHFVLNRVSFLFIPSLFLPELFFFFTFSYPTLIVSITNNLWSLVRVEKLAEDEIKELLSVRYPSLSQIIPFCSSIFFRSFVRCFFFFIFSRHVNH